MIVSGLGRARFKVRQRFEFTMKRVHRILNWLPILATALPIALFILGAGAWGKEQHPIIHGWVSTSFFVDVCFPLVTRYFPVAFYAIYTTLFFQKRIARVEVLSGVVLYSLVIGGFWCFVFLLSGLANQGAGR